MIQLRKAALAAAVTIASAAVLPATAALAQTHHGFLHRHSGATGVVAAAATHHALKVSARHKKAQHRKLNFAERHPTLTAIGAAAGTHHLLKASAHHKGH